MTHIQSCVHISIKRLEKKQKKINTKLKVKMNNCWLLSLKICCFLVLSSCQDQNEDLQKSEKITETKPISSAAKVPKIDTTQLETQYDNSNSGVERSCIGKSCNVARENYKFGVYGYGKNNVKLLHVRRNNNISKNYHEIGEYEIDVNLRLNSRDDYLYGDNRKIIATDSQKNTIYILAKKHGVKSPEEFGILICSHFLGTYSHVEEVNVRVEKYPWRRYYVRGKFHNHAFIFNSGESTRYSEVSQLRNGVPQIRGGLYDLRILKTTQSSFTNFIQDEYRTLPDVDDRIFSTVVTASWEFSKTSGVDFDKVWHTVRECILKNIAGPPDTGIYSPSVQNTLYFAEKDVLDRVKQINSIKMRMPNKHYYEFDFSKFPKMDIDINKEVYLPGDKPSGIIHAELKREKV